MVLIELDYALRPAVHERRVPSFGSIVEPTTDRADVGAGHPADHHAAATSARRRSAAAVGSPTACRAGWCAGSTGIDELAVFDRPAGSERDLVVLAEALGATLVQRHPVGAVRAAGAFGVLRWDGLSWHHEPPISTWIDSVGVVRQARRPGGARDHPRVRGARPRARGGIGALLVYQPD